jgi:hypothetical protein
VSRTGVTLHHSPRYAVDLKPAPSGSRTIPVRGAPRCATERCASFVLAAPAAPVSGDRDAKDIRTLMDRLQKEAGRTRQGVIPIAITFPAIGPSRFFSPRS